MQDINIIIKRIKIGMIISVILAVLALFAMIYDPSYIIEVIISGICAYFLWYNKSRIASTIMVANQAFGLVLIFLDNFPIFVIILKLVFIYFLFRAMIATYVYHTLVLEITSDIENNL